MASVSATSNPTNLRKIARKRIGLLRFETGGVNQFQVTKLDLEGLGFDGTEKVIIIARAGNSSQRYEIGAVNAWSKDAFDLSGLDTSFGIKFRLLLRTEKSARLVATAENLRCRGDGDLESLLPIVSTELGQRLWAVHIDDDGPELWCNSRVFPTGAGAARYTPFRTLVLPEALRQVLEYISADPERVDSEGTLWAEWGSWMQVVGIELPVPTEEDRRIAWIRESVGAFCDSFRCADDLQASLSAGDTA